VQSGSTEDLAEENFGLIAAEPLPSPTVRGERRCPKLICGSPGNRVSPSFEIERDTPTHLRNRPQG